MPGSDISVDAEVEETSSFKLKCLMMDQTLPNDTANAPTLTNGAFFPWHKDSLRTLWVGGRARTWPGAASVMRGAGPFGGRLNAEEVWLRVVKMWMGCVVVVSKHEVRLVGTRNNVLQNMRTTIKVPEDETLRTVTWALDFETLHPMVAFAGKKGVIYVLDVEDWKIVGAMTGHGGVITHLTTHPIRPNYILSTSRDHTARMWSLADPVDTPTAPAFWPGQKRVAASLDELDLSNLSLNVDHQPIIPLDGLVTRTGPAGSVSDVRQTGVGAGVCVAVFKGTGDYTGGHDSWVLYADFHPTKPFVATCGGDRAVKIWRVPDFPTPETKPLHGVNFSIVEMPLFSSTHLHETAVDYVSWLTDDLLVSKSLGQATEDLDFTSVVVLWKWLDVGRFAPAGLDLRDSHVKPSYWDWKESRAYLIISDITLPFESAVGWRLSVCPRRLALVIASRTDAVHFIDIKKHLLTPKVMAARKRALPGAERRRRRRAVWHPVDLDEVPHPMATARSSKGSFEIVRGIVNPLAPRVLLGIGRDGIMALWYDETE
ncbi:WD40 repeat-like protein [Ceratobasidium sp. AG-I]|nr:WD40 repeat-like protein [Ceratobasidium sp. AG-I]